MSLSALIDAYGTVDERQELIDLHDAAIERDELLSLVKRARELLDNGAPPGVAETLESDMYYWIIDHSDDDAPDPMRCPECGNRPPTICKMSCDTRAY